MPEEITEDMEEPQQQAIVVAGAVAAEAVEDSFTCYSSACLGRSPLTLWLPQVVMQVMAVSGSAQERVPEEARAGTGVE